MNSVRKISNDFSWAAYGKFSLTAATGFAISAFIGVPADSAVHFAVGAILGFPVAHGFIKKPATSLPSGDVGAPKP